MYQTRDNAAETEIEKAMELNPSYATAHHYHGILLLRTGRREEALQEALTAQKLDPLSPQIATFAGITYDALGSYDRAESQHLRALELQPDFLPAIANLAGTYWHEGKFDDVERLSQTYMRASNDEYTSKLALATNYALAGKETEARRTMAEAEEVRDPTLPHNDIRITYHIGLRELDRAVELIEDEFASGADWLGEIAYDPLYAPVSNDPRVKSILRKVGAAL
jgi:Flp pilus assembly protein TadD